MTMLCSWLFSFGGRITPAERSVNCASRLAPA
jgi:hypothetical protein